MLENVIETTENCRYCLMCRHVCPVAYVTKLETLTPHGWGLTIASVRRGLLELDESTVNVIFCCADCGTCRAHCATDQPLPSAIAAMRAEIVEKKAAPAIVYDLKQKLDRWENPFEEQAPQNGDEKGEIALFVGDDARYLQPTVLEAALRLLEAAGVKPVQIGVGRNNGYLATSLGFPEIAARLTGKTMDELRAAGAKKLLVLSPGDYYTFSQLLEDRLGLSLPAGIELQEVTRLLAEKLRTGQLAFKKAAGGAPHAYVDPTHSVRVTSRFDAPRELLAAVMPRPAVELFWRRERAHPVGSGALQYTQPDFAAHLAWARLGDARQSGAQLLFTEDAGTLAQLNQHAPRFGLEVQGLYEHLVECLV